MTPEDLRAIAERVRAGTADLGDVVVTLLDELTRCRRVAAAQAAELQELVDDGADVVSRVVGELTAAPAPRADDLERRARLAWEAGVWVGRAKLFAGEFNDTS